MTASRIPRSAWVVALSAATLGVIYGNLGDDLPVSAFFNHTFLEAHCPQAHLFVKGETT